MLDVRVKELSSFKRIRKRDGRLAKFDRQKIVNAINKALITSEEGDESLAETLTDRVIEYIDQNPPKHAPSVEEIQDVVEQVLIKTGLAKSAKAYILYRAKRTRIREGKSELMETVAETLRETNRDNANIGNSPSAKMLQIASAASKSYYLNCFIPEEFADAHICGDIHIHDLDFYAKTVNCLQIPLYDVLISGFNPGYGYIRPPKRLSTASALSAIIFQNNQNDMFGGQSYPHFDRDFGRYIREFLNKEPYANLYQSMEGLIYNLNTMHSRAGAQVPFSSINLGTDTTDEGRLVTKAFLEAFSKGLGRGENPIFPNIVFRLKAGINYNPQDPNYDLYVLALKVAGKRMNPTFSFMDSTFNKPFGDEVAYMGCRTRVINNVHGPSVSARRGNTSFCTVNLPRIALRAKLSRNNGVPITTYFFKELDRITELIGRLLYHRFEAAGKLKVKDLPFLMGQRLYMGSELFESEEDVIRPAILNGTLTIGFIGLAETLMLLTGRHHAESEESQDLGLEIVKFLRNKTDQFTREYNLNYTMMATPAEGLAGRLPYIDRKEFGTVKGATDKDFYTNSFHVPVDYKIHFEDKVAIEGPYHKYCNAGHITYVELASPPGDNWQATEAIIRCMYENDAGYGGINFPIDECRRCGYSGIIAASCDICGSTEIRRVRRITGYLSTIDRFNPAKTKELTSRTTHYKF